MSYEVTYISTTPDFRGALILHHKSIRIFSYKPLVDLAQQLNSSGFLNKCDRGKLSWISPSAILEIREFEE